jgi:hypothetical protein
MLRFPRLTSQVLLADDFLEALNGSYLWKLPAFAHRSSRAPLISPTFMIRKILPAITLGG